MTDSPEDDGREPMPSERLDRVLALGLAHGASAVQMLRQHNDCDCLSCQLLMASAMVQWMCQGEDLRQVDENLGSILSDLSKVHADVKAQIAFHVVAEEHGITPDTPAGTC